VDVVNIGSIVDTVNVVRHGVRMGSSRFDDLLSAAANLLDGAGAAAVTLRDVASAVGISHNAPYRHFTSKHDILEALIAREIRTMCEAAERAENTSTLQTLTQMFADWALTYPERFRLLIQQWPHGERKDLRNAILRWDAIYTSAAKADQANGVLPDGDPVRLGYLIRSTTLGSVQHYLASGGGGGVPEPKQIIGDLFRLIDRRTIREFGAQQGDSFGKQEKGF
jgi:AcrR family transcriptional regulator